MTIVGGVVAILAVFAYISFVLFEDCRWKIQKKESDKEFCVWYGNSDEQERIWQ